MKLISFLFFYFFIKFKCSILLFVIKHSETLTYLWYIHMSSQKWDAFDCCLIIFWKLTRRRWYLQRSWGLIHVLAFLCFGNYFSFFILSNVTLTLSSCRTDESQFGPGELYTLLYTIFCYFMLYIDAWLNFMFRWFFWIFFYWREWGWGKHFWEW